jgi:5-methylcytosine-specific restriction endonuclease McrA
VIRLIVALLLLVASVPTALAQSFETLPRGSLTPGVIRDSLTTSKICRTKWGSDARKVTKAMKNQVMQAYGFDIKTCPYTVYKGKRAHRVEIDHLIPRSLGGADDVRNLWPECYEPVMKDKSQQANGAHKKDRLETYLHRKVCHPQSAALFKQYQNAIAANWLLLYWSIYGNN